MKGVWNVKCSELVRQKAEEARVEAGVRYEEERIASGGFVRVADGSVVAVTDARAAMTQYSVDANGRLTVLAQTTNTLVASSGTIRDAGTIAGVSIAPKNPADNLSFGGTLQSTIARTSNGILQNFSSALREGVENNEVPNSKNTMIVVIYGSNQFPGQKTDDQTELPAFDKLTADLREDYQEVWPLISGENPFGHITRGILPDVHIEARSQVIQNQAFIASRINANPNLHFIVFVGYSWGGGDVYEIANWLTDESGLKIKIAASVYVDAVRLQSGSAENRLPPGSQSMLNIFQSYQADASWLIGGSQIIDSKSIKPIEVNLDEEVNAAHHGNIDEIAYQKILDFIHSKIIVQL